jgi:hypothetical protein
MNAVNVSLTRFTSRKKCSLQKAGSIAEPAYVLFARFISNNYFLGIYSITAFFNPTSATAPYYQTNYGKQRS